MAGVRVVNEKVDCFSELVIYLSFLSLAEKPELWRQFGERTEKGLLFIAEDFKDPGQSDVFRELENLSSDVKQLASKLKEFCAKLSIDQLEPLEAILPKTSPAQIAYNQGITYLRSNQYNEATAEFQRATSLDPRFKEAYYGLGLAYFQMDDHVEAKQNAEMALAIDPHYRIALDLLDEIKSIPVTFQTQHTGTSKPTPTEQTSQPVKPQPTLLNWTINLWQSITPNLWQYTTGALAFVLVICIATFAMQMRAKDEALHQRETELKPVVNENRKLENRLTEKDKKIKKLQNQLDGKDKKIKVQEHTVRQLQSVRRQNQKLLDENTALREQLDKLKPIDVEPIEVPSHLVSNQFRAASPQKIPYSNSRVRVPAIGKNNEGVVVFKREQYNKAIALFKNAIESAPNSVVIYYNLGCTYLAMREYILAGIYLLDAIAHDPNFKEAHYNLALAWFRRGYHQEAIDAAHKALTIDKNYQPARQLLEAIE
jgi:tetratricopeptide (TPR) repeat protein